jgi:hypothetical protein
MIMVHGMITWRAVKDVPGEHTRLLDLLHVLYVQICVGLEHIPTLVVVVRQVVGVKLVRGIAGLIVSVTIVLEHLWEAVLLVLTCLNAPF